MPVSVRIRIVLRILAATDQPQHAERGVALLADVHVRVAVGHGRRRMAGDRARDLAGCHASEEIVRSAAQTVRREGPADLDLGEYSDERLA